MHECNNCDRLEEKYDNLYRRFDRLSYSYRDLEKKYNSTYDELNSAESRIHNELEPRIEQEHKSYDSYVLSGGSDPCFQNGMSGNCGMKCEAFGSKEECFDRSDEELIKIYEEGYSQDKIKNIFIESGKPNIVLRLLKDDVLDIDDEILRLKLVRGQINEKRNKIIQDNCEHEFEATGYGKIIKPKVFEYEYRCKNCKSTEWRKS